jgi:hypothetical protein
MQQHRLDLVGALNRFDHRIPNDLDLGIGLKPLLQDAAGTKGVPTMNQMDFGSESGHEQPFVECRIATADHGDLHLPEKRRITGGAIGNTPTRQPFLTGHAQPPILGAGGQNNGTRQEVNVTHDDPKAALGRLYLRHPFSAKFSTVPFCLLAHRLGQLIAVDAVRLARVVLHQRRERDLPARHAVLEHHRAAHGPRTIERGGQPGRAATDDNDVIAAGIHGFSFCFRLTRWA